MTRPKLARKAPLRVFDAARFMAVVAKHRPIGDSWGLIREALNYYTDIGTPNGAKRWTTKLVRETFHGLLEPGKTERDWCREHRRAQPFNPNHPVLGNLDVLRTVMMDTMEEFYGVRPVWGRLVGPDGYASSPLDESEDDTP